MTERDREHIEAILEVWNQGPPKASFAYIKQLYYKHFNSEINWSWRNVTTVKSFEDSPVKPGLI